MSTPPEIQALRDVCRGEWTFAFVEVAMGTGCRRGEALALEWTDVDWEARVLRISKAIEQTATGLHLKRPKNNKSRRCQLPAASLAALREHRRDSVGHLIFERSGTYMKPDLVSRVIVRRLRKAGIEDASVHSLRHTHASNLLSRGVPLPAISARLGHADPNVTARIYCHALPLDDCRAADEWDALLAAS